MDKNKKNLPVEGDGRKNSGQGDGKKKKRKDGIYDPEYIAYCEHGDSAAVFIMRDIQKNVDTTGFWIDIIESDHRLVKKRNSEGFYRTLHDFKYFVVELFPRVTKPDYAGCWTDDEKRYETWATAKGDIFRHRASGYVGRKYRVDCRLEIVTKKVKNKEGEEVEEPKPDYKIISVKRVKDN